MADYAALDLSGWEIFCQECGTYRSGRLARERDVFNRAEYIEIVCNTCHSILLTAQRASARERLNEHTPN